MKLLFRILILYCCFLSQANATSIIRDSEIESILRDLSKPIFEAAGLTEQNVDMYIVKDRRINAFVSGGQNIFLNTGLIAQSKDPSLLVGVIAHEVGHIAGGHLVRFSDEIKSTYAKATLGYILGIAAAAAGSPAAGQAIAAGGTHVAQRQLLKHTRTQEEAADQAALRYLDAIGYSATGLRDLLTILYNKENSLYGELNPYTLTHPLSRERISHVNSHIEQSPNSANSMPQVLVKRFARAVVKLEAFLDPYEKTLKEYPPQNTSNHARYARAIAYYKIPDLEKSLLEINLLVKKYPNDPYINELKGQILYENGRVQQSIPYYQKAQTLLPSDALLKIQLASSQIATESVDMLEPAITNLEQALHVEKDNIFAWHQLAIAYGRSNNLGMSNLALAEKMLRAGNKEETEKFIKLAKKYIETGSPADLRLNDISASLKNIKKR